MNLRNRLTKSVQDHSLAESFWYENLMMSYLIRYDNVVSFFLNDLERFSKINCI